MRDFLKNKIAELKKDKIQLYCLIIAAALAACHAVIYKTDPELNNLVSLLFCVIFIPLVIVLGRRVMAPYFYIFSLAVLVTGGTYKNYSAAWFCTLAIINTPRKWRPLLIAGHLAATVTVCELHHKTTIHLIIYILNAVFLYSYTTLLLKEKTNIKLLNLKDDERAILEELKKGKQQKEIKLFSVNTITKKLRDARIRNNLETNSELLMRYINETIA